MSQSSIELFEQIKDVVADLWWLSESDAPIKAELWEQAFPRGFSKPEFWQLAKQDPEQKYQKTSLENFLKPAVTAQDWHGEEEQQDCQKFQQLQTLLTESLQDIRVIKLGEVCLDVFILGQTSDSDWIVVSTQSVES